MQEEHLNGFYDNKGEPLNCPYSEKQLRVKLL